MCGRPSAACKTLNFMFAFDSACISVWNSACVADRLLVARHIIFMFACAIACVIHAGGSACVGDRLQSESSHQSPDIELPFAKSVFPNLRRWIR